MIRPLQEKQWGNKANNLTATAATQKQAWAILLAKSDLNELKCPKFEDVYEIPKP